MPARLLALPAVAHLEIPAPAKAEDRVHEVALVCPVQAAPDLPELHPLGPLPPAFFQNRHARPGKDLPRGFGSEAAGLPHPLRTAGPPPLQSEVPEARERGQDLLQDLALPRPPRGPPQPEGLLVALGQRPRTGEQDDALA